MLFRTGENIIIEQVPTASDRKFTQSTFTFRDRTKTAIIMKTTRRDSVAVFEISPERKPLRAYQ